MKKIKLYGEIAKVEQEDDGSVIVHGYASSEAIDSDGEVITAEAMKAALPDYMKFANVREMHQPSAVGTAVSAEVVEDGRTAFAAKIVDANAVKKVLAGVYKGFSIGARVTERVGKIIKGLRLLEVSLVDRPANPDAVFMVAKVDGGASDDEEITVEQAVEVLKKGGWELSHMIDLMQGMRSCMSSLKADNVGDGSREQLEAAMTSLGEAFAAHSQTWLQSLTSKGVAAGLAVSKADLDAEIEKVRKTTAEKGLEGLAAVEQARDEAVEKVEKLQKDYDEAIAKVDQRNELIVGLAKAWGVEAEEGADIVTVAGQMVAKVSETLKALSKLPRPISHAVRATDKVDDMTLNEGISDDPANKVFLPNGEEDKVASAIKAAQQRPFLVI